MDLNYKVVVITGASKGLGKQTAFKLSDLGARVILVARSADLPQNVTKEIKETTGKEALSISCDISDETDVKRMATIIQEKFQRVDVLIKTKKLFFIEICLNDNQTQNLFLRSYYDNQNELSSYCDHHYSSHSDSGYRI